MLNNIFFRIPVKFHEFTTLLRIFLHFIIQIINLSIYISSIIIIIISHKLPNCQRNHETTKQLSGADSNSK